LRLHAEGVEALIAPLTDAAAAAELMWPVSSSQAGHSGEY